MYVFLRNSRDYKKNFDKEVAELMKKDKRELAETVYELECSLGLGHSRELVKKFDKEYDTEDLILHPDRTYAGVIPDFEEVYRRYYKQKKILQNIVEFINNRMLASVKYRASYGYVETRLYLELLRKIDEWEMDEE